MQPLMTMSNMKICFERIIAWLADIFNGNAWFLENTCNNSHCLSLTFNISDYKDAVLIESSIHNDVDCIVMRNAKDYTASSIPVYSPSEFLKLLDGTLVYCTVDI